MTITQKQIDEFKKQVATACILIEIEITKLDNTKTTEYYTTLDVDVVDKDTNTIYKPLPFTFEGFEYQMGVSVDNITLVIDNVNLQQTSIQLNKDQRGNSAVIGYAILDNQGNILAMFELFSGRISQVKIDNKKARFIIKHELLWWNNTTLRYHLNTLFPNQKDINKGGNQLLKWGRS